MRLMGGVLPFFGFASRFITVDGEALGTKEDAETLLMNEEAVLMLEVFEISWLDRFIWLWVGQHGLIITGLATNDAD